MSQTPKPHDNFFRENFGQVEVARDYLQNYLPPPCWRTSI
jgi:hypothetical protein